MTNAHTLNVIVRSKLLLFLNSFKWKNPDFEKLATNLGVTQSARNQFFKQVVDIAAPFIDMSVGAETKIQKWLKLLHIF